MADRFLIAADADDMATLEADLMATIGLATEIRRNAARTHAYTEWRGPPARGQRGRRLGRVLERHAASLPPAARDRLRNAADPEVAEFGTD